MSRKNNLSGKKTCGYKKSPAKKRGLEKTKKLLFGNRAFRHSRIYIVVYDKA